jgi:histone acetyltransferase 1
MGSAEEPLSKRLKVDGDQEQDVAEQKQKPQEGEPYVVPGEEVLRLCFIHAAEDVTSERRAKVPQDKWFCPTFTHQVFGQDEVVRGYENIQIKVYLHALTMHSFVEITCEGKQPGADDVRHMLTENLGLQFTEDAAEFVKQVRESEPLIERSLSNENATTCGSFDVVRFKPFATCESSRALKSLHDRLQAMPLLYVDAANYIDNTDPSWDIYLAVFRQEEESTSTRSIAGFCTVYSFYAYPETQRLRLSQILVMPPFQRKGIASGILQQVYSTAVERKCTCLTVEGPSEEFQAVRERVDLGRVLAAPGDFYAEELRQMLDKSKPMLCNGMRAETLLLPTKSIYHKAEKELKVSCL